MAAVKQPRHTDQRGHRLAIAAGFVVAACLFALQQAGYWTAFDARLQDKLLESHPAAPDIAIVAIDDESIQAIGRWPWDRKVHAAMIAKLAQAGAAKIGYDVTFSEPSNEENDSALAAAIKNAGNVVLAKEVTLDTRAARTIGLRPLLSPLPRFQDAADQRVGHTALIPDADGLIRRYTAVDAFAARLAGCCDAADEILHITYAGGPGTYATYAFDDVLEGRVPAETFRGKIVLVGSTAADLHDAYLTPKGGGRLMSGVEIQANILQTLRDGRSLIDLPWFGRLALYLVLAGIVLVLMTRLRLRYGLAAALGLIVLYMLAALVAASHGMLLPVFYPILLMTASAAIDLAHRYLHERDRRRWIRGAFGRYLAPQVIGKIEAGEVPLELGGVKRELTVLFSDIRGFTSLSEGLAPEILVALLNEYLTGMTRIVLKSEGVVDKYIGDAIMAFWGAPVPQEDHAARAAEAALDMRGALRKLNAAWQDDGKPEIKIGIGINTGDAVVGNMGSEQRFDYTVMGDNVNLASRLEGLTKFYGVTALISDATRQALGDRFLTRPLDLVAVKGKTQPVKIHELMATMEKAEVGEKALAAQFEAALALYFSKRWDEAEAAFEKLAAAGDAPSKLFVERCQSMRAHDPGSDWNGAYVAKEK